MRICHVSLVSKKKKTQNLWHNKNKISTEVNANLYNIQYVCLGVCALWVRLGQVRLVCSIRTTPLVEPGGVVRMLSESNNPLARHILILRLYEHVAYSTYSQEVEKKAE
jgi:hypothetical protein